MNPTKFARIAESLRQYRRAELKDFDSELGGTGVNVLYVDPLPNDAVLTSVISGNTTFLIGRKGTGKSTVFAKAQNLIREKEDLISIYIDVKTVYETIQVSDVSSISVAQSGISSDVLQAHLLRKNFLKTTLSEILKEVEKESEKMSRLDRWRGKTKSLEELQKSISELKTTLNYSGLKSEELPTLSKLIKKHKVKDQSESSVTASAKAGAKGTLSEKSASISGSAETSLSDFEKSLNDSEAYEEYSNLVMRSLPFDEFMTDIRDFLYECNQKRLVIFFDDYSELKFVDQRLFVDVVMSPLNNSSHEAIKLKVAGYPGRVYFGKIDPSKVDTISLDFSSLHEANEVQTMELAATDYAKRLLTKRFAAFRESVDSYLEPSLDSASFFKLMFQATFNVPRLMEIILHTCYLDRISKKKGITAASIRLATRKHYENVLVKYFDRLNRYALEPFENKLDRHNQLELTRIVIEEAKRVRTNISSGKVGGGYFKGISSPPVSHFLVSPELEPAFQSLEANFIATKYKDTRDKSGNPVVVMALFMGLTESERISWGYPAGREYRHYFVQRCFDYSDAVHEFLEDTHTIRCEECGSCFPLSQKKSLELYKWCCPECRDGICSVVKIAGDFEEEVNRYKEEDRLEPIEIEILSTLSEEEKKMRAGEISRLIDTTYQLVGRRTSKLNDLGLVEKNRDLDDKVRSQLTARAGSRYFSEDS